MESGRCYTACPPPLSVLLTRHRDALLCHTRVPLPSRKDCGNAKGHDQVWCDGGLPHWAHQPQARRSFARADPRPNGACRAHAQDRVRLVCAMNLTGSAVESAHLIPLAASALQIGTHCPAPRHSVCANTHAHTLTTMDVGQPAELAFVMRICLLALNFACITSASTGPILLVL